MPVYTNDTKASTSYSSDSKASSSYSNDSKSLLASLATWSTITTTWATETETWATAYGSGIVYTNDPI